MCMSDVYTAPRLRQRLKVRILAGAKGGAPGQWSARKAQLLALQYARAGGGYLTRSRTPRQRSLRRWTQQRWRTRSGRPSTQGPGATGERYLPAAAIAALTPSQYAATTRAKRLGLATGRQFVPNTPAVRVASRAARAAGRVL
jgi:hypothetical protein